MLETAAPGCACAERRAQRRECVVFALRGGDIPHSSATPSPFFLAKHKTKCAGRLRAAESQFIYSLAFDMIFTRESAARLINNAPRDIRRAALELDVNRARRLLLLAESAQNLMWETHTAPRAMRRTHTHAPNLPGGFNEIGRFSFRINKTRVE